MATKGNKMIQIRGVGQIGFVSTAEKANFDFVTVRRLLLQGSVLN